MYKTCILRIPTLESRPSKVVQDDLMDKRQNATQANQPNEPEPGFFYSFFNWLSFIYTSVISFFKSLFSPTQNEPVLADEFGLHSESEVEEEDDAIVAANLEPVVVPEPELMTVSEPDPVEPEPILVPKPDPIPISEPEPLPVPDPEPAPIPEPVSDSSPSTTGSASSQSDAKPLFTREDSKRVIEKQQSNPEPENYHDYLCTLSPNELTSFVQNLDEKGLHFHYCTEGRMAKLTSKTNLDIIAQRMQVTLPLLSAQQVTQLSISDQFWILAYKIPGELAAGLNASCLEALSKDKKHARDFKKIIVNLPDDAFLFDKLLAIAPQITQDAEQEFTMKVMRLVLKTPKEERKGLQEQLHKAMPLKPGKSVGSAVSVRTQFNPKNPPSGEGHDALTKSASCRV